MKEITFLIESPVALHTALPYITAFRRNNIGLHFVVDPKVIDVTDAIFNDARNIIDIRNIDKPHRLIRYIHNVLRICFTKNNFSPIYQRWLRQRLDGKNRIASLCMLGLSKWGPKWVSRNINNNLYIWINKFLNNPFPTRRVIYVTNTSRPHLLCARDVQVYTIVESWDHAGKAPIGHPSKIVFVWNKSIQEDWVNYQGDKTVIISYPVKLDYAIAANQLRRDELVQAGYKRIMYPTTYGATSDERCYQEELRLIEALCNATMNSGWKLLIKPKPNSTPGELDSFLRFPHVEIGNYQANKGGSNYSLSDVYNKQRLNELNKCDAIINLGTTFAFDAAAFGLPVFQIKLVCPLQYPALSDLSNFPHLSRHIYKWNDLFSINDNTDAEDQLEFARHPHEYLDIAREFSLHLRKWITPDKSMSDAASDVVKLCIT